MHRVAAAIGALATVLAIFTIAAPRASADGGGEVTVCDHLTGVCKVVVSDPGSGSGGGSNTPGGGDSGGGGASSGCQWHGASYPCVSPDGLGYFSDGCYFRPVSPPPAASEPVWSSTGHTPSDNGALYEQTCLPIGFGKVTTVWFATPPAGPPPPPPAVTLAQRALASLRLPTLSAASNGGASKTTYVNVKTWLWATGPWEPLQARAAVGTRAVTLVAKPVSTVWNMGDGAAEKKTCDGPGKPFDPSDPNDPPCGYTYAKSSIGQPQQGPSPNDRYFQVQGSVVYEVRWTCAGNCDEPKGSLPDQPRPMTAMPLRVFEIQTVVGHH